MTETRRRQRRMKLGFLVATLPCIALFFVDGTVATLVSVCVAGTAIVAFWITYAHNASHRQKLDELASAEQRKHEPLVLGGHRRWRSS